MNYIILAVNSGTLTEIGIATTKEEAMMIVKHHEAKRYKRRRLYSLVWYQKI